MRPKKKILLISANPQDTSILKFTLETHAYKVLTATTQNEAIDLFTHIQIDLVLADYAMTPINGAKIVEKLKQIAPHVPMILLGDPQAVIGICRADVMVAKFDTRPLELLERVKVMSARKRGPRKGTPRPERKSCIPQNCVV